MEINTEPGIINRKMLESLVFEQGPKGEARALFLHDGIKLDKVYEIRIEFLNILKIDNLWIMGACLTRLKLSNNVIEKIENLESLVNLVELDLSFNRIKVIENLDSLVKLKVLLLFENKILTLDNGTIDGLVNLTILSVGANMINNLDHVMYLRKFPELRSLNVAGNPCTEKDEYFKYVVAFLPQLKYLNYKMIIDEERKLAREPHQRAISNLEELDSISKKKMQEQQEIQERIALVSLSYVEYLEGDEFFKQMYTHDRVGDKLSMLNEDTQAAYEEYKNNFIGLTSSLYELGLHQQAIRSKEIKVFRKIVDDGREAIQKEARQAIDNINQRKFELFAQVEGLVESIGKVRAAATAADEAMQYVEPTDEKFGISEKVYDAQRITEEFNNLLKNTWTSLMHKEVVLHEQIEDTNETFKIKMSDMVDVFLDGAHGIFTELRNIESEYKDSIEAIATVYINNFSDQIEMPSQHVELCGDKETLNNSLAASHDLHMQTINDREDVMVSRLKIWYEKFVKHLEDEETQRNRQQILEISHFLDYQRQQFDALRVQLGTSPDNSDHEDENN